MGFGFAFLSIPIFGRESSGLRSMREDSRGRTSGTERRESHQAFLAGADWLFRKLPSLTESEKFFSHVSIQTRIARLFSAIKGLQETR